MFTALILFFRDNVFDLGNSLPQTFANMFNAEYNFFGVTTTLRYYLCFLCALVSEIIILVLCCLFVYKIIKLIGGLIR